jgi:hypothetical protein
VTYTNAEARQELLDSLAGAADRIGVALAYLSEAYEGMDDDAADRLEERLFRPTQTAYGRAKRTYAEFANRYGLPSRPFAQAATGLPNQPGVAIDEALQALREADDALGALQDSMLPVEVGDPELRAGLAEVRMLIGEIPDRARDIVRTLGR